MQHQVAGAPTTVTTCASWHWHAAISIREYQRRCPSTSQNNASADSVFPSSGASNLANSSRCRRALASIASVGQLASAPLGNTAPRNRNTLPASKSVQIRPPILNSQPISVIVAFQSNRKCATPTVPCTVQVASWLCLGPDKCFTVNGDSHMTGQCRVNSAANAVHSFQSSLGNDAPGNVRSPPPSPRSSAIKENLRRCALSAHSMWTCVYIIWPPLSTRPSSLIRSSLRLYRHTPKLLAPPLPILDLLLASHARDLRANPRRALPLHLDAIKFLLRHSESPLAANASRSIQRFAISE